MTFRQRLEPAAWLWLATTEAAFAADGEPMRNAWSLKVQGWLLHWGIWYTGLHRVDDGALFGLICCIVLTTFMVSAMGLMLFRIRGLSFTSGWLVGLPVCVFTMLLYCKWKPFPTYDDLSWIFTIAGAAQLAALTIAWAVKSLFETVDEEPPQPKAQKAGSQKLPSARPAKTSLFEDALDGLHLRSRHRTPDAVRDRMKLAVRPGGIKPGR